MLRFLDLPKLPSIYYLLKEIYCHRYSSSLLVHLLGLLEYVENLSYII